MSYFSDQYICYHFSRKFNSEMGLRNKYQRANKQQPRKVTIHYSLLLQNVGGITASVKKIISLSEWECCALLSDFLLFFWIELFIWLCAP